MLVDIGIFISLGQVTFYLGVIGDSGQSHGEKNGILLMNFCLFSDDDIFLDERLKKNLISLNFIISLFSIFQISFSIIVVHFIIDILDIISFTHKYSRDFHKCETHFFVTIILVLFQLDSKISVDVMISNW